MSSVKNMVEPPLGVYEEERKSNLCKNVEASFHLQITRERVLSVNYYSMFIVIKKTGKSNPSRDRIMLAIRTAAFGEVIVFNVRFI